MLRLRLLIFTFIIMLAMTSPIQAPFSEGSPAGTDTEAVINEIIADFSFLCSILAEAESCEGYPVVSRFGDLDSAVDYLSQGFEPELAQNIAQYLLTYNPDIDRVVIIPSEFIPVITAADRPYLQITHLSSELVIAQRYYEDCYQLGDRYCYTIEAHKRSDHWKISDLHLEPE